MSQRFNDVYHEGIYRRAIQGLKWGAREIGTGQTYQQFNDAYHEGIYHRGVRGMKWGVRKAVGKISTAFKNGRVAIKRFKEKRDAVKRAKDDELRRKIERLANKKRYLELKSEVDSMTRAKAKAAISKAFNKFAESAIQRAGQEFGNAIGKSAGNYASKVAFEKQTIKLGIKNKAAADKYRIKYNK